MTTGNNTKNQSLLFIRENYNGEYIDWDAFFDEQDKIKESAKNGIFPDICIGCHYLKNKEWDNIDVPRVFKDVMISHYLRCNSNCILYSKAIEKRIKQVKLVFVFLLMLVLEKCLN